MKLKAHLSYQQASKTASPIYHIELKRKVQLQKDVTIKLYHKAKLESVEHCEQLCFMSTPNEEHPFKEVTNARGLFYPGCSYGEITLRHFCNITIAIKIESSFLLGVGVGVGVAMGAACLGTLVAPSGSGEAARLTELPPSSKSDITWCEQGIATFACQEVRP